MEAPDEADDRAVKYVADRKLTLSECLGAGTQGTVYLAKNRARSQAVAVKFHEREIAYQRERDVYLRLRLHEVTHVCGHRVPVLVHFDDNLLAIEMTIVSPPFALDFGGAYLDRPPDYSDEVWEDWRRQKAEDFEENWPAVQKILGEFERFGVFVADVNPGNVRF